MQLRASRTFFVEPTLPAPLEPLRALAHNLYWTWSTDAAALFERIDRDLWRESGHNPIRLLQSVPQEEFERLATDDGMLTHLDRVMDAFRHYLARPAAVTVPGTNEREVIAYFSLEFALTESLPSYSGGLGVLAGDHLKSASDLGLPLVGVGLLYRDGYFHQVLAPDGWQNEEYHHIDLAHQPLVRERDTAGEPLAVDVPFDGRNVRAEIWRLDVGEVPLYLLDTNVAANAPADQEISARLYGGDIEMRIKQEMLLGIGGVRALRALGLYPAVCHMNEGHSALLGVERIRLLMEETGLSFEEARLPVSAATVFTTHTAVAAGIDLFPPDLVRSHLAHYYGALGLSERDFLGFGRTNRDDDAEPFSMALLGLRLSGYRNGVSLLHRTVSRQLWAAAWPDLPIEQIPIDSITNGVHLPTWVSDGIGNLYDEYAGRDWRDDPSRKDAWDGIEDLPPQRLWDARVRQRHRLVQRAREQHHEEPAVAALPGVSPQFGQVLDPNVLTIGFARRFAGYKRATLLFRDPERLARILNHPERPVQFIFAGKAHPRDESAKQLIREVVTYSRMPEFRDRLIVLRRYDVELARLLVQGCDIWLNTPLRPLEASGTSGMKAVANGALHMSVRDGWWYEAYQPGLGWQIGRNHLEDDPEMQDACDAESVYELLENEVAPLFYERDGDGVPVHWVQRMKASIAAFAPQFSTDRMVRDYASRAYGPAAGSWARLRAEGGGVARNLHRNLERVRAEWPSIAVLTVEDDAGERAGSGKAVTVRATIALGALHPNDVRVDIVYGVAGPGGELSGESIAPMSCETMGARGEFDYKATLTPAMSGRIGYKVRIVPGHPDVHNAMDLGLVRWA